MIFEIDKNSSQNHSCTLNTILNIEEFIQKNSGIYSKTDLWNVLPKKIMYQSYKIVLEFLLISGKIQINKKKVIWIGRQNKFNLNQFKSCNHNSTLTTILNILEFVHKNSGNYSKTDLWNALPKKIMYQSYKLILEYLSHSELIYFEKKKVLFQRGELK